MPALLPNEVVVFNGASEGIVAFMSTALLPGDHMIVQFPEYRLFYELARSIGYDITFWSMNEELGWNPDLDELKGLVRPTTRALVINSPRNPTGHLFSMSDFQDLAQFAGDRDIVILSDEVYRLLEHEADDRLPLMADLPGTHLSLGGLSKAYRLAGLRIGWIVTHNPDLLRRLVCYKDYSTICNNAISEFFAVIALHHHGRIIGRNLEILRHNIRLLGGFFEDWSHLFSWVRPRAGSTVFPQLKAEVGVEEFCADLLEVVGVLLIPGTIFEYDRAYLRLGYGRMDMPEALQRFEDYLEIKFE